VPLTALTDGGMNALRDLEGMFAGATLRHHRNCST